MQTIKDAHVGLKLLSLMLFLSVFLESSQTGEAIFECVHAAFRIENLLFACVVRVAGRTDFNI